MFESLPDFPLNRRWRGQAFPSPVVVAIIQRQTAVSQPRCLLIRRVSDSYIDQWALVGGKWDFGETLVTAVTREVKEETNLNATFTALRGIVSERVVPPDQENDAAHFLIFVCELSAPDGVAREQNEGAVAWFTRTEIDELHAQNAIIPSDYRMLQQFAGSTESVSHVEAEMLSALGGNQKQPAHLIRFERVNS
ncbi:MAG: NUDIX hydrolase [Anaerolineales bacterium]|nr:NUDIX hydrolase [Anaerolineales bacterium]